MISTVVALEANLVATLKSSCLLPCPCGGLQARGEATKTRSPARHPPWTGGRDTKATGDRTAPQRSRMRGYAIGNDETECTGTSCGRTPTPASARINWPCLPWPSLRRLLARPSRHLRTQHPAGAGDAPILHGVPQHVQPPAGLPGGADAGDAGRGRGGHKFSSAQCLPAPFVQPTERRPPSAIRPWDA